MRKLNSTFRGINKSTDVLSFESRIHGVPSNLPGDVVICIPRAEMQARQFGVDFYSEISRLLIHGILHLFGYEHEQSQYRARAMRKKEQEILNAIKKMD